MIDFDVKQREYTKIFAGTNQTQGYENIILGFTAATTEINFKQGEVTYFHYPGTAEVKSIHDVGLASDGATPGYSPNRADRIYKKLGGYKDYDHFGSSSDRQNGTWLCSWLSGSEEGDLSTKPIWKDRFYDPGYVTLQQATSAFQEVYYASTPVIWDEDSSLTLEPGVLYKYHHFGDIDNVNLVQMLSGSPEEPTLRLCLDSWSGLTEQSIHQQPIVPHSLTESNYGLGVADKEDEPYLSLLQKDQYISVPYNKNYTTEEEMTVSVWLKVNDWNKVDGHQIVGNGIRTGWSIYYDTGFFTPTFPIFETTYGHVILHNIEGDSYRSKRLPEIESVMSSVTACAQAGDQFIWAVDNRLKQLYKIDLDGSIVQNIKFSPNSCLTDLAIDSSGKVSVLDCSTKTVSSFLDGIWVETETLPTYAERITYNTEDILVYSDAAVVRVDSFNNVWEAENLGRSEVGRLLKNGDIVSTVNLNHIRDIGIDHEDNIWILHNHTDYVKLNKTGVMTLSGAVGVNDEKGNRSITFSNEYDGGRFLSHAWITQSVDQRCYKVNSTGRVVESLNLPYKISAKEGPNDLPERMAFSSRGDSSGYDWYRKFVYIRNGSKKMLVFRAFFEDVAGNIYQKQIKYAAEKLSSDNWHHVAAVYSQYTGTTDLYIDNNVVGRAEVPVGSKIHYRMYTPLLIGADSGLMETLADEIKSNYHSFKGSIDDLRIYSKVLTKSDISHIMKLKYDARDMTWNIPTGSVSYLEEIERFFKNKLPGSKSAFYNIHLNGLSISDEDVRAQIEATIRQTVKKISPAHTQLYKVIWE